METRHLLAHDLEAAFLINEEYLSASRDEFFRWYAENADLFVGIFDQGTLIGICYGMDWPRQPGYVILEGIATQYNYWRSGAGSQLIRFFEEQVRKRGRQAITVGSAADLKTENFYLKNGYLPVRLCTKMRRRDLPSDYMHLGYEFCEIREDGENVVLYVATTVRDKKFQAKLKNNLGTDEVIFIMEKAL
ncbi:MAG: GNAT family N-acetyltransferase [Caldilinea sp. CFX5]|nr:GNAT family N-acetyltransferase [Caldilinea sp. CFX5]